ncbi:MAG: hypothetical protein HYZ83_03000 [Candidatus Omnitrophica bacterium]|nr:hypothetical protein [Candidatus Omnitrophota bacterium]
MRLRDPWVFAGMMGMAKAFRQYQKGLTDFATLQAAIYYLKAIQGLRHVSTTIVQISFCIVTSLIAIVVLHVGIFLMLQSTVSLKTTAWIFLGFGILELGLAVGFIAWLLSAKRWINEAKKENGIFERCSKIAGRV